MSTNCKIILKGNLGSDPRLITKEGKEFIAFSMATTDSYLNKETGRWEPKKTIWHDVLIFRPLAIKFAKDMKKGERVHVEGTLSYTDSEVKNQEGYPIKETTIIGGYIAKAPLPSKGDEEAE